MSDALRELLAVFTTEVDTSALEKGNEKVEGFSTKLKELAFTVGEIFALEKLTEFVKGTTESVEQLEVLSNRLGVTTDDIQKFQYAVRLTGGDIATANQGLTLFSKNVGESLNGGGGAQYFQKLGVTVRSANGEIKPTSELLGDVAEGFGKLTSDGERTAVAMGLFGRSGAQLIPILKKGKEGFAEMSAELQKNGGLIDERTIKVVALAGEEMKKLSFSMNGVKAEIVAALAPAIISLVHWIQSGAAVLSDFAQHTTLVQGVMVGLIAIATVATVVWGALNLEFLLIVAGVALLIIVLDDLYGWWTGKDSFFGRVLDKVFGKGTSTQFLSDAHDAWKQIAAAAGKAWIGFVQVWDAAKGLGHEVAEVGRAFDSAIGPTALDKFSPFLAWVNSVRGGLILLKNVLLESLYTLESMMKIMAKVVTFGAKVVDAVKPGVIAGAQKGNDGQSSPFSFVGTALTALSPAAGLAYSGASAALPPLAGAAGAFARAVFHQQNQTTINIHGAKDADDTADKTGKAVEDAHRDHANDFAAMPGGG